METSLAHLVPEFTANLVGSILLLGYMLRERDRYRVRKREKLLTSKCFCVSISLIFNTIQRDRQDWNIYS